MITTINRVRLATLAALVAAVPAFAQDTQTIRVTEEPAVNADPASVALTSDVRPVDRIVAVVNNDVITEYELQNRVRQVAINLRQQNIELPSMNELRNQVIERLILEKAIDQRAKELGIRVDEQMVSASIEQIARNNKLTVAELRERLQADDVSYSAFRRQIRDEIMMQRLREREVDSQLTIPESEVDAYLAEEAGFTSGDTQEYHVQHILLPIPPGASDREADAVGDEAESIARQARQGEDFGKLAAAHSKGEDALQGGDLGWRDASRLPSIFWQAIENHRTERNYVTVVQSSGAYHVVKLVDNRDGVKAKLAGVPVEQTHARHILMFVSDMTPESEVLSRLHDIKRRIEAGETDFATMARLTSVDNSATRGGDLGWLNAGDTVPEFESAMNRLQPGEVSDPIRTQYGYHLIQVVERRTAAGDATRSRLAARMALREKKLSEAVYNWQRELRDRAYVEIRKDSF